MKILHIHPSLQSGGIEAIVSNLANEMSKRNDVTFCSLFETNEKQIFLQNLNKQIKVFSLHKTKPGFNISILWKIFVFIKSGHYDIVHIHGFFYYYILAIFLLHSKTHFFYTIHNDAIKENSKWDKKLFFLKKLFFKFKFMIPITISKASQKSFKDLYGINGHLIYNGTKRPVIHKVDLNQYRLTPKTKIILNPGRICTQKNQIILCEVCQQLITEGNDIVLLIAGLKQDNDIYSTLSTFFSKRIIYLGERDDITSLMASVDAFCLSSLWEGMPITLLEALAVGCVPICTPVGGVPEAIENGKSGFLSNTTSKQDIYNSIKEFLNTDENIIKQLKTNALTTFETFDISNTAKLYEKYYHDFMIDTEQKNV